MKSNKSKNKKTQYAFGGTAMNIDSPSESLSEMRRATEDALMEAMYNPTSAGLKGIGSMMINTGFSMAGKGFSQGGDMSGASGFMQDNFGNISKLGQLGGGLASSSFATGGTAGTNINAEGQEIVESPNGVPLELVGPSHANGGIDLLVPPGTDVYSKRLKGDDGNTYANRKKSREKEIAKIQKLLDKTPNDKGLKNALARIKANNDMLDEKDVDQMNMVRSLTQPLPVQPAQGVGEKFALGGTTGIDPNDPFYDGFDDDLINKYPGLTQSLFNLDTSFTGKTNPIEGVTIQANKRGPMDTTLNGPIINTPSISGSVDTSRNPSLGSTPQSQQGSWTDFLPSMTLGDATGFAGNLISTFGPIQNTLRARRGDIPEQNFYKQFGQNALKTIRGQAGFLDDVRDQQLQSLELARQGTMNRNNGSARGLNTIRALNLAADAQINNTRADIQSQYAQQMMGIMGQEANQLNSMDQAVMRGEEGRSDREVKNRDNFFSNLAKDIATMGQGIATTGKNMNQIKERDTINDLMGEAFNNFSFDPMTGQWTTKQNQNANVDTTPVTPANMIKGKSSTTASKASTSGDSLPSSVATTPTTTNPVVTGTKAFVGGVSTKTAGDTINKGLSNLGVTSMDFDNPKQVIALQRLLGVKADGKFGKSTLNALTKVVKGK